MHIFKLMAWTVVSKNAGEAMENWIIFRCFSKMKNYIETSESGLDLIAFENDSGLPAKGGYVPPDMELNS